jgi:ribosomal protein S18 acetylase RimI-like enzyme
MKLRDLSPDDLAAVAELDRLCFSPETAFSPDVFESCLLSRACDNFGIEQERRLVAFAVLHFPGPRAAHLFTLDVHPRFRRQGLADTLMAEMEKRARGRHVRRIALQVATDNEPALALYHKWGFSIRSELPHYYGRGKDAYLMDKIMMDLPSSTP